MNSLIAAIISTVVDDVASPAIESAGVGGVHLTSILELLYMVPMTLVGGEATDCSVHNDRAKQKVVS